MKNNKQYILAGLILAFGFSMTPVYGMQYFKDQFQAGRDKINLGLELYEIVIDLQGTLENDGHANLAQGLMKEVKKDKLRGLKHVFTNDDYKGKFTTEQIETVKNYAKAQKSPFSEDLQNERIVPAKPVVVVTPTSATTLVPSSTPTPAPKPSTTPEPVVPTPGAGSSTPPADTSVPASVVITPPAAQTPDIIEPKTPIAPPVKTAEPVPTNTPPTSTTPPAAPSAAQVLLDKLAVIKMGAAVLSQDGFEQMLGSIGLDKNDIGTIMRDGIDAIKRYLTDPNSKISGNVTPTICSYLQKLSGVTPRETRVKLKPRSEPVATPPVKKAEPAADPSHVEPKKEQEPSAKPEPKPDTTANPQDIPAHSAQDLLVQKLPRKMNLGGFEKALQNGGFEQADIEAIKQGGLDEIKKILATENSKYNKKLGKGIIKLLKEVSGMAETDVKIIAKDVTAELIEFYPNENIHPKLEKALIKLKWSGIELDRLGLNAEDLKYLKNHGFDKTFMGKMAAIEALPGATPADKELVKQIRQLEAASKFSLVDVLTKRNIFIGAAALTATAAVAGTAAWALINALRQNGIKKNLEALAMLEQEMRSDEAIALFEDDLVFGMTLVSDAVKNEILTALTEKNYNKVAELIVAQKAALQAIQTKGRWERFKAGARHDWKTFLNFFKGNKSTTDNDVLEEDEEEEDEE